MDTVGFAMGLIGLILAALDFLGLGHWLERRIGEWRILTIRGTAFDRNEPSFWNAVRNQALLSIFTSLVFCFFGIAFSIEFLNLLTYSEALLNITDYLLVFLALSISIFSIIHLSAAAIVLLNKAPGRSVGSIGLIVATIGFVTSIY